MGMVKFTPLNELFRLQERMNRILEDLLPPGGKREVLNKSEWTPRVDIYETTENLILEADMPELNKEDVTIKIDENNLILSGERKRGKAVQKENYYCMERPYGCFERAFNLPDNVDRENIKASFKDGVLKITMARKKDLISKEIKIEIN